MNLSQLLSKRTNLFILLLTLIGALLHFYNLNWGAPFYFHPDERNIASSVSQLLFPDKMNPRFFAYGSLPIYTIYFTGLLVSKFHTMTVGFDLAIQISRFYSALFATTLIPILFLIGKKLKDEKTGLITAFLTTSSVGFIQFAHFGTFEMWLTFFSVLLFWICITLPKKLSKQSLLTLSGVTGILVAIKISHLMIIPLVLLILFVKEWNVKKKKFFLFFFRFISIVLLFFIISFLIYYLTNPFVFLDFNSFKNSINYESRLALGTLPVFYTGEFFNTIPIIFQFTHIYPFLINPLITILFIPAFIYFIFKTIKTKNAPFMILVSFFMILFLSQAFLFAKWTRYMMPTLPFIFLIVGIALTDLSNTKRKLINNLTILIIVVFTNMLFAFSYFVTVFIKPDTRVAAYQFAQKTTPFEAPILSEVYDLGIIPFNQSFTNITLFNFYDLDNFSPEATPTILQQHLLEKDYIILPSQRISKPRLIHKEKFPQGHAFYKRLLAGSFGFQKIYESPCDLFCKITYLGDPIDRFESTTNVFDRPTIMIFKKIQ